MGTQVLGGVMILGWLAMAVATPKVVIVGEIFDSQCAFNVHSSGSSHAEAISSGKLGDTPEECVQNCLRIGGTYALVDAAHQKVYHLANAERAEPFAAKRVLVKGSLAADDVLTINSISLQP